MLPNFNIYEKDPTFYYYSIFQTHFKFVRHDRFEVMRGKLSGDSSANMPPPVGSGPPSPSAGNESLSPGGSPRRPGTASALAGNDDRAQRGSGMEERTLPGSQRMHGGERDVKFG